MPTQTGAESSWIIRSADTPEEYKLRVALPSGAELRYGPSGGGLGFAPMGHSDLQVTTEYLHDVEPYLRRFRRAKGTGQAVRDILRSLKRPT